jgi:hypothetical protein
MLRPSNPQFSIPICIGFTIGGGGAGWLGAVAVIHKPSAAIIGVTAVIAALAANLIESICKSLPEIIKAKGDRETARIKASGETAAHMIKEVSEAQALIMRTRTRTMLLQAGVQSGLSSQAAEMLRQQSLDVDLPRGRRFSDEALAPLLAEAGIFLEREAADRQARYPNANS